MRKVGVEKSMIWSGRYVAWVAFVLLFVTSSCSEQPKKTVYTGETRDAESVPKSPADEVAEKIRALIPAAAGAAPEEFRAFAASETLPKLSSLRNQPFSIALFYLHDEHLGIPRSELNGEFQWAKVRKTPAELVAVYERAEAKAKAGYLTAIPAKGIKDVTSQVTGDTATGVVTFQSAEMPSLEAYAGNVRYVARKTGDAWRVEEFELPVWGLKTTLQPDGTWRSVGDAVNAPLVQFPSLSVAIAPMDDAARRIVLNVGLPAESDAKDARPLEFFLGARPVAISDLQQRLHDASSGNSSLIILLRADRSTPLETIRSIVNSAAASGLSRIAFRGHFPNDLAGSPYSDIRLEFQLKSQTTSATPSPDAHRLQFDAGADGLLTSVSLQLRGAAQPVRFDAAAARKFFAAVRAYVQANPKEKLRFELITDAKLGYEPFLQTLGVIQNAILVARPDVREYLQISAFITKPAETATPKSNTAVPSEKPANDTSKAGEGSPAKK